MTKCKNEWQVDSFNKETIMSYFEFGVDRFKERYKGVKTIQTTVSGGQK